MLAEIERAFIPERAGGSSRIARISGLRFFYLPNISLNAVRFHKCRALKLLSPNFGYSPDVLL